MKNKFPTFATFLLLNLPQDSGSFTTRPAPVSVIQRSIYSAHSPQHFTALNAISSKDSDRDRPVGLLEQPTTVSKSTTENSLETAPSSIDSDTSINTEKATEELTETQRLLQKVKQAGTAGAISYALWELGFWGVSIPVCIFGYRELTGHWPDLTNGEDVQKVGAEAFAFVNFARLAVPLRIGLALSTTGWIEENVVKKFLKKNEERKD